MIKILTIITIGAAILMAQGNDQSPKGCSAISGKHCKTSMHHGHDSTSVMMECKDHDTMASKGDKNAKKLSPQSTCPVMGGTINKNLYADFDGKRVFFCCSGCVSTFNKEPAKYIKKLEEMGQLVESLAAAETKSKKKP